MDRKNNSKNGFGEKQSLFIRQVHKMYSIQTEISCLFVAVPLAFTLEKTNMYSGCLHVEPIAVSKLKIKCSPIENIQKNKVR